MSLTRDLRIALRTLARRPAFTGGSPEARTPRSPPRLPTFGGEISAWLSPSR